MDFGVGKSIFKSESGTVKQEKVKQENGFRIKSEFEPSLSSLPLAAPAPGKKEFKEDSKSGILNIPQYNTPGGRGRRRRYGNAVVHYVGAYRIAAHYGKGQLDFTVTREDFNIPDGNMVLVDLCYSVDWNQAEREVFRRLRAANYHVELTDRRQGFLQEHVSRAGRVSPLKFSIPARRLNEPRAREGVKNDSRGTGHPIKKELKEERDDDTKLFNLSGQRRLDSR